MKGNTYSKRNPFPYSGSRVGNACAIIRPWIQQTPPERIMGKRLHRRFMQALLWGDVDKSNGRPYSRVGK